MRRRILVAEDDPVSQRLARLNVELLGYAVHAVATGREAVEELSQAPEQYALILMDWNMPEMDGLAATRAIRKAERTRGAHTPIIAMTANARPADREACIAAGMDDYISKPVDWDKLREMIERWIPTPGG